MDQEYQAEPYGYVDDNGDGARGWRVIVSAEAEAGVAIYDCRVTENASGPTSYTVNSYGNYNTDASGLEAQEPFEVGVEMRIKNAQGISIPKLTTVQCIRHLEVLTEGQPATPIYRPVNPWILI